MKKKLVVIIWQVKDIDRTTIFKDSDELKYNITIWAKFKVDFKNSDASGAAESNIPEKFRGIQYYKTKESARKAVAQRKKLKWKILLLIYLLVVEVYL